MKVNKNTVFVPPYPCASFIKHRQGYVPVIVLVCFLNFLSYLFVCFFLSLFKTVLLYEALAILEFNI